MALDGFGWFWVVPCFSNYSVFGRLGLVSAICMASLQSLVQLGLKDAETFQATSLCTFFSKNKYIAF